MVAPAGSPHFSWLFQLGSFITFNDLETLHEILRQSFEQLLLNVYSKTSLLSLRLARGIFPGHLNSVLCLLMRRASRSEHSDFFK